MEVWQTSNLRRLRLGEEKKERRKKERTNHSMKIYMVSLFHRATINNGHYAVQGHLRSPILVAIESSYATSYWWLINNLPPYLAPFPRYSLRHVQNPYILLPLLCLTPATEGFPWDDLSQIFRGCQRMARVPNAVEILQKITTAWVGCTSVTDRRQTNDRRTGDSI